MRLSRPACPAGCAPHLEPCAPSNAGILGRSPHRDFAEPARLALWTTLARILLREVRLRAGRDRLRSRPDTGATRDGGIENGYDPSTGLRSVVFGTAVSHCPRSTPAIALRRAPTGSASSVRRFFSPAEPCVHDIHLRQGEGRDAVQGGLQSATGITEVTYSSASPPSVFSNQQFFSCYRDKRFSRPRNRLLHQERTFRRSLIFIRLGLVPSSTT